MQQRYFDAEIGRFISPDPVGPEEDFINHFNRYNYAQNNPVRYTDPDGRRIDGSIGGSGSGRLMGCQGSLCNQHCTGQMCDYALSTGGGMARSGNQGKESTNQSSKTNTKVDILAVTFGGIDIVTGSILVADGTAVAIIGAVTLQPEIVMAGGFISAVGFANINDGTNAIKTGFDGKERDSTYGQIGRKIYGEKGAEIGNNSSKFLTLSGGLKAIRNFVRKSVTDSDALEVIKASNEASKSEDP